MIDTPLVYTSCFGVFIRSFSYKLVVLPTTVKEMERLLEQAAPLTSSPAISFLPRNQGEESDAIARRLSRWRNNAAENCGEAFAERLAWDGLTPETAGSVLGDGRALELGDHSWALAARKIIRHLTEGYSEDQGELEVPFAPVLSPLVDVAMRELSTSAVVFHLSHNIDSQLRKPLYIRFSDISHRAIGGEFRRFRGALPHRDGAWRAFEEHMRRGGLLELLERLPVLLRLLATATSLWVNETAEFFGRLEADREALGKFCGDRDPGAVERISGGVSDPHHGGRNVKIVHFASGLQVVYKPKDLAIDAAWFKLTDWLSLRTGVILRSPGVLNRGDWGWAEFIPHLPLKDRQAADRFYRRAGHLLCLLYVTMSSDFHEENLIASGEFPVPIDLETVFNPEPCPQEVPGPANLRFLDSVLQTLMLPTWVEVSGQSDAINMGALGSRPGAHPDVTKRRWIRPNGDAMEFVATREKRSQPQNTPFWEEDGQPADAGEFVGKLADGFAEAYDCVVANREALLSSHGPLEAFRNCRTRFVLRPTWIYNKAAERALSESCFASGVDRSLEFEGLSRHFLAAHENHGSRAMFRAELRALEQMDIPYFQLDTGSRDVLDEEGRVIERDFVKTSGYDKVRERIAALSSADRDFQLELIHASFVARDFGGPDQPPIFTTMRGARESDLLDSVRGIARDIEGRAIWNGGEAAWIGYDTLPLSGRLRMQPLGASLYSGVAGIAIFLAAQFAVDGGQQYRGATLGIARSLRRSLLDSALDRKTVRTSFLAAGIGGAAGAGSTIYGLLKAGQILNDEEILDTALCLSRLLDGDAIRGDRKLDVVGGAAGAILALLALWSHTGEAELLRKAVLCGERLLEAQTAEGAWLTSARRPLAGFSHGAAGIGLALLRLHAGAPDPRFLKAAMAAFAYERTLLSPVACDWKDLRDGVPARFGNAGWCHGAPGIALSRIGALKLVAEETESPLRSDLDFGLRYLTAGEIGNNGTVCCGEMGRAEVLMEAARYLARPELEVLAKQRVSGVVAALLPVEERPFVPGFFQGSAGIGYGLLRLMAPGRLPSVLLWE